MKDYNFTVNQFINKKSDEEIILEVLREAVYKDPVISAEKVARKINIPYKTLSRMLSNKSLEKGEPKFPLIKLPALADLGLQRFEEVFEVISALCGYNIIPIDITLEDVEEEKKLSDEISFVNALKKAGKLLHEASELSNKAVKSLEDGKLTEKEKQEIKKEINKVKKSIAELEFFLEYFSV